MITNKPPALPVRDPEILPSDGIRLLNQQIQRAEHLLTSRPIESDASKLMGTAYKEFSFQGIWEHNSPNVSSVVDIGKYGGFPMNAGAEWWQKPQRKGSSIES